MTQEQKGSQKKSKNDPIPTQSTKYQHDPYIDPYLSWAGKQEHQEVEVHNTSLHIHEKIDPQRIISALLKPDTTPKQPSFFEDKDNVLPLDKAVHFYRHAQDWTNRLIAGDSLLIMNSLLHKEIMGGKVQMIYIDPPYGIRYNSNFQPFTDQKEVKDKKDEDLSREPEVIKAFRDTWELGIHSYLTYLRDRLLLARDLLHESGSVFVQISDENQHFIRNLLDEVFTRENFVAQIAFRTKNMPMNPKYLEQMCDFIIWYAKDKSLLKYRQLYVEKDIQGNSIWKYIGFPDNSYRKLTQEEINNHTLLKDDFTKGGRIFQSISLEHMGTIEDRIYTIEFQGKPYKPKRSWTQDEQTMQRLIKKNLLMAEGQTLRGKYFWDSYPVQALTIPWTDTNLGDIKTYVVQTAVKVLERCVLMTTDPGDLVFDPTCGSGTTAYVAEKWGRRWISCDTSRVALQLTKQRLMTASYEYFDLVNPQEGVKEGFRYKTVPHMTLKSIAQNTPTEEEILYDQPSVSSNITRVTGPFTVEAVPGLRVKSFLGGEPRVEGEYRELFQTGETNRHAEYLDILQSSGLRARDNKVLRFSNVSPMHTTECLHARGTLQETGESVCISFAPDYASLEKRQVEIAMSEVKKLRAKDRPVLVIFAAFHFDAEASKYIYESEWSKIKVLPAQMNGDLLTSDLRKSDSSSQSYWILGQPEIKVIKEVGKDGEELYRVRLLGVDYYDYRREAEEDVKDDDVIISVESDRIAMWYLDTNYDETCLFPDQVFFPLKNSKLDWTKLGKTLKGVIDERLLSEFTGLESLPFKLGDERRIAVKVIDHRGIESLVVKNVK